MAFATPPADDGPDPDTGGRAPARSGEPAAHEEVPA